MRNVLGLLGMLAAFLPLGAADWPQFRGPDQSGVSRETGLLKTWKEAPKLLWQTDKAGLGYAGMAVVGGVVYTLGERGGEEYAIAFDGKGTQKWATKLGPVLDWKANQWSRGPNTTPTVDGDLIYCLSSKGMLMCLNKEGKEQWKIDLPKDMGGIVDDKGGGFENLGWGYTSSPIVDGDQLLVVPGGPKGMFAAVDKKKGTVLWRSKDITGKATYVTPVLATIHGVKQLVYVFDKGVMGVSTKDGSLLWKHERDDSFPDVVCPSPIVSGDIVYASVGEGGGSVGLKISKDGDKLTAKVLYADPTIGNYHTGVVLVGGHVFGYHEKRNWACQNLETGKVVWPTKSVRQTVGAGGIAVAEGRLYVLSEAGKEKVGQVAMLDASPREMPWKQRVLGEFTLPARSKTRKPSGGVWTYPTLSDGKLYVRDNNLLFCYQVK